MTAFNESTVEDTTLEWFGALGYAIGHGPHLAPGEPAAERDSFDEVVLAERLVVLAERLRESIRRLTRPFSRRRARRPSASCCG